MTVESAYDFPLPGFWSDRAVAEQVCDIDGTRYLLRQLDEHVLYRVSDRNCVEHTFFVPYRTASGRKRSGSRQPAETNTRTSRHRYNALAARIRKPPRMYSQSVFTKQISKGENGRVTLYCCPDARDCNTILFFRQDGTGYFLDFHTANGYSRHEPTEQVDFVWDGTRYDIAGGAGILTAKWAQLEPLCHEVFTKQVWRRMKNPFVRYKKTPDAPLVWQRGSQEELFRISHCIFHTQPGDWSELELQAPDKWTIENHCFGLIYVAEMEASAGGASKDWPERIRALCDLAFQHNTFTGYQWVYSRYNKSRRKSYTMQPLTLTCRIAPPSAHERAEALLTLWDWLEDKVSEAERRAYCGVD